MFQTQLCCWNISWVLPSLPVSSFPSFSLASVNINICRKLRQQGLPPQISNNKTSSSLTASFWGTCLLGSSFVFLRWFELARMYLSIVSHRSDTSESICNKFHRETSFVYVNTSSVLIQIIYTLNWYKWSYFRKAKAARRTSSFGGFHCCIEMNRT